MRVLWLAKRHYTNKDALTERFGRVYELPREWSQAGEDVRLELLDYRGAVAAVDHDGQLNIATTPTRSIRSLRDLVKRCREFQPDVILASGDCFVGLLALWLARRCSATFVFDVYDDYRTFSGYRAFLGWDAYGFLIHRAQQVLYASSALAVRQERPTPWKLVPNGVDPDKFHPTDQMAARVRTRLNQPGVRWVGYFGGMDVERGVEDLISAVGLLHAKDHTVRLVLCGTPREGLKTDQPWVDFRGPVEHGRIPDFINACDVVALPYRHGRIIDMASSCKIAEYLYCERPVVTTETPNLFANFPSQAAELGSAICKPADPVDLARALDFQLTNGVVVSRPEQHTWTDIARETLSSVRRLDAQRCAGVASQQK